MKLHPQQAPLYGQCLITVTLDEAEEGEEDVEYFLFFTGCTQRHLTSTLRVSQDTLQALCPAHDCSETVQITLCSLGPAGSGAPGSGAPEEGPGMGRAAQLAQQRFCFVQDPAFDMAQFLVSAAGRADSLEGALWLDECHISVEEFEDRALAHALQHLTLPPGWSLLGGRDRGGAELGPQETLLHFAARRGLSRVADFLLEQPAALEALRLDNRQGHTPAKLAELRGHTHLSSILAQAAAERTARETERGADGGTDGGTAPDARVVCHLPDLNTHTLTVDTRPGREPPTVQHAVRLLCHWSRRLQAEGVSSLKLHSDWRWTRLGSVHGGDTELTVRTDPEEEEEEEEEEEGDRDPDCSPPAAGPAAEHRGSDGGVGPQDGRTERGAGGREESRTEERGERRGEEGAARGGERTAGVGEGTQGEAGSPPAAEEGESETLRLDPEGGATGADSGRGGGHKPPAGRRAAMGVTLSSQSSVTSDSAELPSEEGRAEEEEGRTEEEEGRAGEEEGRAEEEEGGSDRDEPVSGDGGVPPEVTPERLTPAPLETHALQQQQETAAAGGPACKGPEPLLSPAPPGTRASAGPDAARPDPEPGEHLHSTALREAVEEEVRGAAEEEVEMEVQGAAEVEVEVQGAAEEEMEVRGAAEEEVEVRGAAEEEMEVRGAAEEEETAARHVPAPPAPEPELTERTHQTVQTLPVCTETRDPTQDEQNPGAEPVPLTIEEEEGGEGQAKPCQEMKTDAMLSPASPRGTTPQTPEPSLEERLEITESSEVLMPEEPSEDRGSRRGSDTSGSDTSGSDTNGSDTGGSDTSGQQSAVELDHAGSEVTDVSTALDQENSGLFQLEQSGEDRVEDITGSPSELLQESPPGPETADRGTSSAGPSGPGPEPVACEDEESGPEENPEDSPTHQADVSMIHRDVETTCRPVHSSSCPGTLSQPAAGPHPPRSHSAGAACGDSVSDTDSFPGVETGNDDNVFSKGEEVLTGGDSTSELSLSSADDPSSSPEGRLEPEPPGDGPRGPQEPGPPGPPGEADDEAKDRVTEVLLRPGRRSLSPLRRHSWGPGRNAVGPGRSCEADGDMNYRSYSLEGLSGEGEGSGPSARGPGALTPPPRSWQEGVEGGGGVTVSLRREKGGLRRGAEEQKSKKFRPLRHSCPPMSLPLTKSVSMMALSQRDMDGMRPFSSASCSLAYSISEEDTGSLRSDSEGRSVTKVGRTFSYLKNKMSRKSREKEKKTLNGHVFSPASSLQPTHCVICSKALSAKDFFNCTHCNASVHKGCMESLPSCLRVKMKYPKQQLVVPDAASFPVVTLRNRAPGMRDRPWSAILSPDEHPSMGQNPRRPTSIMAFHGNNLSKSLSISNIAGPVFDDMSGPIKGLRYLSQSTDSLSRTKPATESMESLIDEGTEMMEDRQLMGDLEVEVKELEADSWTFTVDQSILDTLTKDQTKKQDVIYELMQTEMHHLRTLRIMSEVYARGLLKDAHLKPAAVDKMLPGLDDLLELHTHFLKLLLERRQRIRGADSCEGGAVVHRVGDLLLGQFSGSSGEEMRRVYGRFCGSHSEAVNFYKDLLTKDKHFQVFVKKKMSSSIVRRLGIPECILLVTQRITKYPVLIQRILQYTDESEEDHGTLSLALVTVKEVIAAVDTQVNETEKRRRLTDVHARMESKSIMRMKSGQMFAREDLLRGRRLLHEGALQLKNNQGRMKDVLALLLSDVFVFLQEKDQKYVFASLDQRSTVLSLQKLIVREVANEERGIFLISAGADRPEMLEAVSGSKEERNTWMQLIQDAVNAVDREDDEGIPSETEEDKRQMENKFKEMREALRQRDVQIVSLLEQKVQLFREMCECGGAPGPGGPAALFRASGGLQTPCGEPIMKEALREVETLQDLVNTTLGGLALSVPGGGGVCLPRRAETFSGFDSRKNAVRVESQPTAVDLRRTGSDSVLKKGGNANLLLLRRNSEQVLHSVYQLHHLLSALQAVVVQQDSLLEDQRQTLGERSFSCASSTSSRPSSRPSSLIEQEKQRSVERRRQELASLHKEQAAHAEERRNREKEWDIREQQLTDREVVLRVQEEEANQRRQELEEENQEFQLKKEQYQRDLERLRDAQRRLDRDREGVQQDLDRLAQMRTDPSSSSEDLRPLGPGGSGTWEQGGPAPWPRRESLVRLQSPALQLPPAPAPSKPKGRNLNPFSSSASLRAGEGQVAGRLLQLAKNKDKDKKKKKKGKVVGPQGTESQNLNEAQLEGEIFFC